MVDGRYSELVAGRHAQGGFLADVLARIQVRTSEVPIFFAGSRSLAGDFAFRFLAAAMLEHGRRQSERHPTLL